MNETNAAHAASTTRVADLSMFECWDMLNPSSMGAVALDDGHGTMFPANYVITSKTLVLRCDGQLADILTGQAVTLDVRGGQGHRGERVHVAGQAMQLQSGVVGSVGFVRVTPSAVSGDRSAAPTSY